MSTRPSAAQVRWENDRVDQVDQVLQTEGAVPRTERVESPPEELYRIPYFLPKTATAEECHALAGLLRKMWEINHAHVGERTRDVEAYLLLTGEDRPLLEGLRAWCRSYFGHRSERSRLTPQDHSDLFEMFWRLAKECDNIFYRFIERTGSLNYIFLEEIFSFTHWLLFERTWKENVELIDGRVAIQTGRNPETLHMCLLVAEKRGFFRDSLAHFLAEARVSADRDSLKQLLETPADLLRVRLRAYVDDIMEMRPFLQRFRPERFLVPLCDNRCMAWQWTLAPGLGSLMLGSAKEVTEALRRRKASCVAYVNRMGLLIDLHRPWVTVGSMSTTGEDWALALNAYLLELIRDRLFKLYERIDFSRIRGTVHNACSSPDLEELDDQTLALSCQDLAAGDKESAADAMLDESDSQVVARRKLRGRSLRAQRLLRLLSGKLGCEVAQGKGSEITLYRPGGRKFILGHHRTNATVPWQVVKGMLNRLGISHAEWFALVYQGRG